MFKVWQNSAPFGGRPIGGAVETLLTKIVNWRLSVLPIVVFFVATAVIVSIIIQTNCVVLCCALISCPPSPWPSCPCRPCRPCHPCHPYPCCPCPCRPCPLPPLPLTAFAALAALALDAPTIAHALSTLASVAAALAPLPLRPCLPLLFASGDADRIFERRLHQRKQRCLCNLENCLTSHQQR